MNAPAFIIQDKELKEQFAEKLLRSSEGVLAWLNERSGGNFQLALQREMQWPKDPYVIHVKKSLLDHFGEEYFLPSKVQILKDLYAIAHEKTEGGRYTLDGKGRIEALDRYAKIRGYYEDGEKKPGLVENHVHLTLVSPDKTSMSDAKIVNHEDSPIQNLRFAK
jgi:hypothetical protein